MKTVAIARGAQVCGCLSECGVDAAMMRKAALGLALAAACWAAMAAALPGPRSVNLSDDPEDDKGVALVLTWQPPEQAPEGWAVAGYLIKLRSGRGEYKVEAVIPDPQAREHKIVGLHPTRTYQAAVAAIYLPPGEKLKLSEEEPPKILNERYEVSGEVESNSARPIGAWFDFKKLNVLIGVVVYGIIVMTTIKRARTSELYIRPIPGLQAVDDAIGRATEMGKPLLYVSGLESISSISTIAATLILGHLARKTAHYETPILVPCVDSLVMAAEREIVREAYIEAGRPDAFRPENIFYVTDSQFGYVAAVDGLIMRERPAACFYMGAFFAESLILAETGNIAGCVQIAGTDSDTQLPFFITACDYTLMGEELYAASAYLSRHPLLVAQLKAQDMGKVLIAAVLFVGVVLATLAQFGVLEKVHELFMKALAT